jgi:hypothetical protein
MSMSFLNIEQVAPRVLTGIGETVNVDDFNIVTGIGKYRGCFVRMRKRSGDDTNLPFDTLFLANGAGWRPTETAGGFSYSNKPFGIIGSYPEKINEPDSGGIHGKLTIHLLGGRQPIYVGFRYVDNDYNIVQPTESLIGRRLYIHGKQVNVGGTNYIVPVASLTAVTDVDPFYVDDVLLPSTLVNDLVGNQRDLGWVVLALDHNFISEPYWYS